MRGWAVWVCRGGGGGKRGRELWVLRRFGCAVSQRKPLPRRYQGAVRPLGWLESRPGGDVPLLPLQALEGVGLSLHKKS